MIAAALAALVLWGGLARADVQYGALSFPRDENQHGDGLDYWWGSASVVTESGNRYTVPFAFDDFYGVGGTGHQVFPLQGPYAGQGVMTMDGPAEWGHPEQPLVPFVEKINPYVPGVSERLDYRTLDPNEGMKEIGRLERTTLEHETYRFRIDDDKAKVHPSGQRVKVTVDLLADMQSPPLLAGGTGVWWYGIPQTFNYPSRSFQYMQAARTVTGTLDLQQPDGAMLHEVVVPDKSTFILVHEYDATPEDLPAGLALAESAQLHLRYAQYYEGGMPWELLFADLRNGAQLMVAVLAFHDAKNGTVKPVTAPDQPTYRVLATLRLATGESVPLDGIHVEHLSYRHSVGLVPTFFVQTHGVWEQAWDYRVSYGGGPVRTADGRTVDVPPFDLGFEPQWGKDAPALDDKGQGLRQRVPYDVAGSYGGCPAHGFAWSETIINWRGHESQDPWFTGGAPPAVPDACDPNLPPPPSGTFGNLAPPPDPQAAPDVSPGGCSAYNPGTPTCEYDATAPGGIGGYGNAPGGWTVTITNPGVPNAIVVKSFGGSELYACGTIHPGDHVVAHAEPGAWVSPGNPGICF